MKAFFIFLLFLPLFSFAQLVDDFSDGDFVNQPEWVGDQALFKVNANFQLQLNQLNLRKTTSDTAYLASPYFLNDSLEWNFYIHLAFSPSGNNFARVYLMADKSDLTRPLDGVFLQFGEGGSADALELFQQQGSEIQSLCRGSDGEIATSFDANIKVIYTKEGNWSVYADWNKTDDFKLEASAQSLINIQNPYFGFFCKFTSSNATKFYFDDVDVNYIYQDREAPELSDIQVLSGRVLRLHFNEKVEASSAQNPQNYKIQANNINPIRAELDASNPSAVLLTFADDLPVNQEQALEVSSVSDLFGNVLENTSISFFYSKAKMGDVIIHEIMADPNPVQFLADAEYIELYNRADYPVQMEAWHLQIGSKDFEFQEMEIAPKSYLLLCSPDNVALMSGYGNVLGIPSFALSNSGALLVLKNKAEQVIHFIYYQSDWYQDDFKADGGWSLEMISDDHFCEQAINWAASENSLGGSPGSENSLTYRQPDYQAPALKSIQLLDNKTLLLQFTKSMDSLALKTKTNYSADHALGEAVDVQVEPPEYRKVQIRFEKALEDRVIYELSLDANVLSCGGQSLINSAMRFALSQKAEYNDLIINEILFDSWQNDGEYVELYNRSDKVIDSRQILFSKISIGEYDTSYSSLQPDAGQIFPKEYLVLCKNKEAVLEVYQSAHPENIFAFGDFPSLPNSEGQIVLSPSANRSEQIDAFHYSADMHSPLVKNPRGIALERLSPEEATNDPKNWESAAAEVNYGTPAYQNSQFQKASNSAESIQITPEIFSPDLDGVDDVLQINYHFQEGGYQLNILIFNAQGQEIKHLVKNELMGVEGQIFWDGSTEEGEKAAYGIYILYFEYFDLNGQVKKLKKTCVLGGRL